MAEDGSETPQSSGTNPTGLTQDEIDNFVEENSEAIEVLEKPLPTSIKHLASTSTMVPASEPPTPTAEIRQRLPLQHKGQK